MPPALIHNSTSVHTAQRTRFFFLLSIWSNAKRTRRATVYVTHDTWARARARPYQLKMQFLCSFYGRTDEVARRFLSRILRTICETMSKQKSIFRRNSSVWLRWIQFFCDHSVSCNFTYPHDAWKIERQKILKTEKKKKWIVFVLWIESPVEAQMHSSQQMHAK